MNWTDEAFGDLVDPYRHELLVHCYRMLGSIDDAEDAVQDALVRAWRGRDTFQRDISFRAWLYRIATNTSLSALARHKRGRVVGPFPDRLLGDVAPLEAGPEARYDAHESISLAFLTALQVLPPRQRAVLLLRDVLAWRAVEVAGLLDVSVAAVNSALQRARAAIQDRYHPVRRTPDLTLLDRYVRAWEAADVAGLVRLLRDDAVLAMPPMPTVVGAGAVAGFVASLARMRLLPTRANGSPAFGAYADGAPFAIVVLEWDAGAIARIDAFADPGLFERFELPTQLP